MSEKILLIDGHSILNRAFYGLPDLTNTEGKHTGAVYGFLNILFRILEEEKPDYLTVAFDLHEPTFRHKIYEAYKGTRKGMPEELREQVPLMKEMLGAMKVKMVSLAGYEADDLLGTLAGRSEKLGMDVTILFRRPGSAPAGYGQGDDPSSQDVQREDYNRRFSCGTGKRKISGDAPADHRAEGSDGRQFG